MKNTTRKGLTQLANISSSYNKEPLFHIAKRDQIPFWKSLLIRVIAIASALLLCGILCAVILKINPIDFYETMFKGVFGSERRIWKMIKDLSVLLCI